MTYMIFLSSVILLLTVGTFAIQNSFADTTDLPENVSASIVQATNTVDTTPPLLTSLELRTSNTDSTRAKQGDIILIALYTDTHLSNASATILNRTVETDIIVSVVLFETIILAGDSGNTSFSVTVYDSSGNGLTITEADITSNNIFIDTAKPVITLNGPANITIERFDTYTDAGATITDEDPKYNGLVSSNASSINTSAIGSYLIEYHAPADLAGNVPASIVRTVNIVDTTLPLPTSLELRTSNTDSTRAKQGDIILISLYTDTRLSDASATILNRTVETTIIDNFVFFNTMILAGDSGNTSFSVTVYDSSGNRLTITEADITSNNIFIDTAKPVITLNGPANITIKRGMEYVDAGVMISDNDPAYNGIISSNATSLDTNYGGTYTIVYSAPPDPAGNEAKNATRTVIISPPFEIYNVAINTTNPNPGYAKENDTLVIKLESDMSLVNTSVSATVFGRQADYNIYDQILYVNQTVKKGDNGYVPFTILIQDNHGASILATNDDLQKNIIVDTMVPQVLSASTITPNLVSITFDEPIVTSRFTTPRITMTPSPISSSVQSGSSIPYSVLEIVLPLSSPLSSDATPLIVIDTSSFFPSITDLAGNALPRISVTADDGIAPSMQSATIVSSALINVIFDEQVKFINGDLSFFFPLPTINGMESDTPENISGNTLGIPSSTNSFPTDTTLNVSIETNIITDVAGNVFKPNSILTSIIKDHTPYTMTENTIIIPYATTLNPNTVSTGDYRVSLVSNQFRTISTTHLSNDATTVTLKMLIPFGTGGTPFVEQIGSITDIFGNAVTMQSTIADDRAPPTLVSAIASSASSITVTFSEKITSQSTNIGHYDVLGTTIIDTSPGIADGTVIISTSTFVDATLQILNTSTISDLSGNRLQDGAIRTVIRIR